MTPIYNHSREPDGADRDTLTLGSLFDGSGGFPLGGLLSGIAPVWASEIEPFPIRVTTKRLPFMKHYGDVSRMDGGKIEPVDIITFGSPCQDMSTAGRREGLDGSRSSLFYEAVRIVKEMRCATDGKYPRYIVWENVLGAFSSNKGADFQSVLEEICSVKGYEIHTPRPTKWPAAGEIVADDFSLAWRVFDAQYWGVPQRRKRIYLVADFAGGSAGKILFESEGVSGYTPQGFRSWQGTAGTFEESSGAAGCVCLNDQGGGRMDVTATLRAKNRGRSPYVMGAAGFRPEPSAQAGGIGYEEEVSPTLCAGRVAAAVYENHSQDARYTGPLETAYTVNATYGTRFFVMSKNAFYEAETSNCLDTGCGNPTGNQGGTAVVLPALVNTQTQQEQTPSLLNEEGPSAVAEMEAEYLVRRLTPLECARLQGFPDWWCAALETPEPTEDEIEFWTEVFETHRKVMGASSKPKSRNQIIKWLKNPHSDSAEYKMWGNGVALPNVYFVLSGIAYYAQLSEG